MEPLRIGQHTLPVSHPHILYARGLLGIYNDIPAERWMLDFAYLGYPIKGPTKPPRRNAFEGYAIYGQRVYNWLTELGGEHWQLEKYADELMSEAFKRVPRPITKQEVADVGEASTRTVDSSNTGSPSPANGEETPSCG